MVTGQGDTCIKDGGGVGMVELPPCSFKNDKTDIRQSYSILNNPGASPLKMLFCLLIQLNGECKMVNIIL